MAQEEMYGNWLQPSPLPRSRLVLRPTGVYTLAGQPASIHTSRSGSPNSFADEEDYDDVSVSEGVDENPPQRPARVGLAVMEKQTDGGTQTLRREPATPYLPGTANPAQEKGYSRTPVVILYVLMVMCFLMWAALLSLALMKYSKMSVELEELNVNYLEMQNYVESNLTSMRTQQDSFQDSMKRDYLKLQVITASLCKAYSLTQECPEEWKTHQGTCYYFSTEKKNWTDARQFCREQEAHLVSINTDDEQYFLIEHVANDNNIRWLGASYAVKENTWLWDDNSSLSFSYWILTKNNTGGNQENCSCMQSNGVWHRSQCSLHYHWICEKTTFC
uniref:C-type lectin domain-containing protein n=1 Tax=Sphenodon punctatus TaxID=8508 RepID=A0A8D0GSN8_SPHPU